MSAPTLAARPGTRPDAAAPRPGRPAAISQWVAAVALLTAVGSATLTASGVRDPRFLDLWVLPVVFVVCYLTYLHRAVWDRPTPLRVVFVAGAYLRYVASPALIALTQQYGTWAKTEVSDRHVTTALVIMSLELVACTLALMLLDRRRRGRDAPAPAAEAAPRRLSAGPPGRYLLGAAIGALALVASDAARAYFTIPVALPEGDFGLDLKETSALDEVAILFAVTAKHLAFLAAVIWARRRFDATGFTRYVWFAMAATVANCVVFFGTNRLATIFVALSSILVYVLLFPRHRLRLYALAVPGLFVVYQFMTRARNYWDPYSDYSGLEHTLRNLESLINHYLGGIHNVAIAAKMAESYAADATLQNLVFDLIRPFPVLNQLVADSPLKMSNQYFNMEFYQSYQMDVILPSVGQGTFYFGPWLAWVIPVALLVVGVLIERWMAAGLRIEYIYLSSFVLMRLGTLMGSNATIQVNEFTIQFLLPLFAVWFLSSFSLRRTASPRVRPFDA